MRLNSLALRLVLGAGLWSVAALAAGGLLLSALFRDYVERSFDRHLAVYQETLIGGAFVYPEGVRLSRTLEDPRFSQPYSGWYWQIDDRDGTVLSSRSLWDETLKAGDGIGSAPVRYRTEGPLEQQLRVAARWIELPGGEAPYLFLVAGDASEIETEVDSFNTTLFWSLGGLGLVLVLAVLIQVIYGLLPLRRVQRQLARIRAGEAEHLSGDFPTEIEQLADELNGLLDHNAEVIERARTEVAPVVDDLRRALLKIYASREIAIETTVAPHAAFRGERQDLEEILGNLMDNACKWARRQVAVAARMDGNRLEIVVDDDGRGLTPAELEKVLPRGSRLDESVPGSGLGLSIVKDISGLYGGEVTLDRSPAGGLRAVVRLPATRA